MPLKTATEVAAMFGVTELALIRFARRHHVPGSMIHIRAACSRCLNQWPGLKPDGVWLMLGVDTLAGGVVSKHQLSQQD